jgi:phosphoserine phosphatase RsbU/P
VSSRATVLHTAGSVAEPLRQVLHEYAAAHGVGAWIWQQVAGEWVLAEGAGTLPGEAPGPGALPLRDPGGVESQVEVVGQGNGASPEASAFLRGILETLLKHWAETRFFGREIAERYEEITLLYTISEILGATVSLDEAATVILREVVDTMAVRRAALWLHDPERECLEIVAAVGGEGFSEPIGTDDNESVTAAVFRERRSIIMEPGEVYPRDSGAVVGPDRESFLSVPVNYTPPQGESRTIGVINLIGRRVVDTFSAGDQKLIAAIASQIGAAVENSRLVAESVRQERMLREMELAHDLQLKLLPSVTQFRDQGEVAARCSPADSVGGDFYHLFRLPGGRLGVVIGDVSSHGFAAALIMALTMSAVAIHAADGDAPAEVLKRVHGALIDELETTEMYLTLFYCVIDPAARRIDYANAGHPHAFRITPAGEVHRLAPTNPPFGIIDLDNYGQEVTPWTPGEDILFLFTDGLSDTLGQSDGERRLLSHVLDGRDRPMETVLEELFALVPAGGDLPADDRTALLLRI